MFCYFIGICGTLAVMPPDSDCPFGTPCGPGCFPTCKGDPTGYYCSIGMIFTFYINIFWENNTPKFKLLNLRNTISLNLEC